MARYEDNEPVPGMEDEEETRGMKKEVKEEEVKEKEVTIQDVLTNHESRLLQLEATMFRLKNI